MGSLITYRKVDQAQNAIAKGRRLGMRMLIHHPISNDNGIVTYNWVPRGLGDIGGRHVCRTHRRYRVRWCSDFRQHQRTYEPTRDVA